MFTKLIRKKGSYMTLAALAALTIAALATLLQATPANETFSKSSNGQPEQVVTGRLTQFTDSPVTFIN